LVLLTVVCGVWLWGVWLCSGVAIVLILHKLCMKTQHRERGNCSRRTVGL
jgi:hypothetical protein